MNKMVLGIDIDGVVADTYTEWLRIYHQISDNRYDISEVYSKRAAEDKLLLSLLTRSDLYDNVLPIKGAVNAVKKLQTMPELRVIFITSCVLGMADSKWRWLQKYELLPQGFLQSDSLILVHDKSLVNVDAHIDDSIPQLERMNVKHKILFDAPWNKNSTVGTRVKGWAAAIRHVKEIL